MAIANPVVAHTPDLPLCWCSAFAPFKFRDGAGAGVVSVSSESGTVGGAGGLGTVGAGAGA